MTAHLNPALLEVLADPETHEPVTVASAAQLQALRAAIAEGKAKRHDGQAPPETVEAALLSQGGRVAYLVSEGIPNFLVDERLELEQAL